MIKRGFINFFKGLKYYLTPFGATLLFIVIGLCIAVPSVIASINHLLNTIKDLLGGVEYSSKVAIQTFVGNIMSLEWKTDFAGSLAKMSDQEYLTSMVNEIIKATFGGDVDAAKEAVQTCVKDIMAQVVLLLVFTILGIIAGFAVTRMQLRNEVASTGKNPFRFFLRVLLDAIVFAGAVALTIWISSIWKSKAIWAIVVGALIVYALITLIKAYIVFGSKRVKFGKVVNPIQVVMLYVADIFIMGIAIGLTVLLYYVFNPFMAIFLCIPLLMIAVIVMDVNAESYVKELAEKAETKEAQ